MPMISVIIPNYNHGRYLQLRIDSILNQTFTDFEIILMDDGSTDDSRAVIERYRDNPKFSHIILNEPNSGSPFKLWDKGIELAKGDWIWIAESDDIAEPNFLEEAMTAIGQFPQLDIFYSDSYIIDENGTVYRERFSSRKAREFGMTKWFHSYFNSGIEEINESLKYDCTVNNMSSAVMRKSHVAGFAKETGEFRFHGDWFFIIKACLTGNIYYCDKPLNHYRIHGTSHSTKQTLLGSRYECFRIAHLLYHNEQVRDKKEWLDQFTYNCLGFGIFKDGPGKGWQIYQSYKSIDKELAKKVFSILLNIKLTRKKKSSFVPLNKT